MLHINPTLLLFMYKLKYLVIGNPQLFQRFSGSFYALDKREFGKYFFAFKEYFTLIDIA